MKARKHIKIFPQLKYSGCVNRWHADERFRETCRSTGNTSEDMQKGRSTCSSSNTTQTVDEGAALNMSHSRGFWYTQAEVDTTPSSPQITQSTASLHGVSRYTQLGEIPRTPSGFKQLIFSITNLAMDKLGLVTKLTELNIPSLRSPDRQERRRSEREVQIEYLRQRSPVSHFASCCCSHPVLTVWSRMHTRLEADQDALHCSSSALPPSLTTHLPPSPTQHTPTTHPHTHTHAHTHPHTHTHTLTHTPTQELPFPE